MKQVHPNIRYAFTMALVTIAFDCILAIPISDGFGLAFEFCVEFNADLHPKFAGYAHL